MSLVLLYRRFEAGELSDSEVAREFGFTLPGFRIRLTKWGDRIEPMLTVLDRILADKMTRDEAAMQLGVTGREINKLMVNWHVGRPVKAYKQVKARSKLKWLIRKAFAIMFIRGTVSLVAAADSVKVSDRQMRRWISDLLKGHGGLDWKALDSATLKVRGELAGRIEVGEGIDKAVVDRVQRIVDGSLTLEMAALESASKDIEVRRFRNVRPIDA